MNINNKTYISDVVKRYRFQCVCKQKMKFFGFLCTYEEAKQDVANRAGALRNHDMDGKTDFLLRVRKLVFIILPTTLLRFAIVYNKKRQPNFQGWFRSSKE